jgi:hypothetical protein
MSEKLIVVAAAIKANAATTAHSDALDHLAKAADCFDEAGLRQEADAVAFLIRKLAEQKPKWDIEIGPATIIDEPPKRMGPARAVDKPQWEIEVGPAKIEPTYEIEVGPAQIEECDDSNDARGKKRPTPKERESFRFYGFLSDKDYAEDNEDDAAWEDEE